MAVRATFVADFTQWDAAIDAAKANLRSFEVSGQGAQAKLQRMFSSFDASKVIAESKVLIGALDAIGKEAQEAGVKLTTPWGLTAKEMARVNAQATEMLAKYRAIGQTAPPALEKIARETAAAAKSTTALGGAFGQVKTLAAGVFAGFTVDRVVYGLTNAVSETIKLGSELTDLSAKTGISTTSLQRLKYAAEQNGVALDTISTSVSQMSKRLVTGDESAVGALRTLGLSFERIRSMEPGKAFETIAAAIAQIPDPMQRAALSMQLFGRGGAELLPLITADVQALGDEAERLGIVMSADVVKSLDDLGDAWDRAKAAGQGLLARTIAPMVPAFLNLADAIQTATNNWETFSRLQQGGGTIAAGGFAFAKAWEVKAMTTPPVAGDAKTFKDQYWAALRAGVAANALQILPADAALREMTKSTKDSAAAARDHAAALKASAAAAWQAYQRSLLMNPPSPVTFAPAGTPFAPSSGFMPTSGMFAPVPSTFGGWNANVFGGRAPKTAPWFTAQMLTPGPIPSRPITTGIIPAPSAAAPMAAVTQQPAFWTSVKQALGSPSSFGAGLTRTVIGAFQGGGSVGKSLGADIGGSLAGGIGSGITSAMKGLGGLGPKLLGFLGGALGPIGSMLGGLLGGVVDKLFGGDARKTRQMRDQWLQQAGGIDEVRKMAEYAGVSIDKLLNTRKSKEFEAQVKKLEAAYAATQKRVQALISDLGKLTTSGGLITQDLLKRLAADKGKEDVQTALGQFLQDQTSRGLAALTALAQSSATLTAKTASGLAGAAGALFQQLREMGKTSLEALTEMAPAIEGIAAKLGKLGLGGGEAFDRLAGMAALARDEFAGPLLSAVDQVGILLTSLANTGWLTEEMFAGLAAQAGGAFQQLVAGGKDGQTAMALMQPTLQRIWELQQQYGWAVDEATQSLLDQAAAQELIGPKFKSATDKMIDAINNLIERLDVFLTKVLGLPAAASTAANGMNDAFDDVRPPGYTGPINKTPPYEDVIYPYAAGGWVPIAQHLASGGWPRPVGTDTVPAMLTPGEFIVSAPAAKAIGPEGLKVINSGQVPVAAPVSLSFSIQAIDAKGVRDLVERDVIPMIVDAITDNVRGARTTTRAALGVS